MISNGEYTHFPQTQKQRQVEFRVKELAGKASKKLGMTRRQFLEGTGGLAASFLAMNEVYGNTFFKVDEVEMFEKAAFAENATPRNLFVFDDQTHIVRSSTNSPQGLRALAQGPGSVSTAAGFSPATTPPFGNPNNGRGGNPAGVDELGNTWTPWNPTQLQPDSPPNPGPPTNIHDSLVSEILTGWQTAQCRDYINQLAGSTRALAHGQLYPGPGNLADPLFGDYTQWQIENMQPDSWKGYNVAFAASAAPGTAFARWRLDDEAIAYPTYQVIARNKDQLEDHPGFFNICIHKGLSANGTQPGGANNLPDFGNPDDIVKVATDWPQFNWIMYHSCIRPRFWVLQALMDIENLPGAMPPTLLTDSHGHSVPNIRWSTQFAQIAGGRYVAGAEPTSASPSSLQRLGNVYAELGTTMASMIVTFPTVWAHLIGQLLHYMGPTNIVFGSDSLWYGGPQWQIEALWRSQIPDDIADRWGYPPLTEGAKRHILGLNSARLYGLPAAAVRYTDGGLPDYATAPELQPGGSMDTVLRGVGYPEPVMPAALMPEDRFAKLKRWADSMGLGRSNTRNGWMRTRA